MFKCLSNCGDCCCPVPIKKEIYERNKAKCQPHEMHDCDDEVIVTNTKTGRCAFLDENALCGIYEERPEVCRLFGDSEKSKTDYVLMCPYLRQDGTHRPRHERRAIEKDMEKRTARVIRFYTGMQKAGKI